MERSLGFVEEPVLMKPQLRKDVLYCLLVLPFFLSFGAFNIFIFIVHV